MAAPLAAHATTLLGSPEETRLDPRDPVGHAHEHVRREAWRPTGHDAVGLELELHLWLRGDSQTRPGWAEVQDLLDSVPPLPHASRLTVEPGGQVELSTPPAPDPAAAVSWLHADAAVLEQHAEQHGFLLAAWGADPWRTPRRVHPGERYAAMEQHFDARGCGAPARAMMASTASLQVNLDLVDEDESLRRWHCLSALVPVLAAGSASSRLIGGHRSGWASARQEQWSTLDQGRAAAVTPASGQHPASAWADYALAAPVMLRRDPEGAAPVRERVSFAAWAADPDLLGRPALVSDLDYHLTTLFPPVRPRGFLEVRCLDASGPDWWPALVALTSTLARHPRAAEETAQRCEGLPGLDDAARHGLADTRVRAAAVELAVLAADHAATPAEQAALHHLASRWEQGRTPADDLEDLIAAGAPAEAYAVRHAPTEHPS